MNIKQSALPFLVLLLFLLIGLPLIDQQLKATAQQDAIEIKVEPQGQVPLHAHL